MVSAAGSQVADILDPKAYLNKGGQEGMGDLVERE